MSTCSTAFNEPSAIVIMVPAMKQPPPPDPPPPEVDPPDESPNPAAVVENVIPELNSAFHVPDTLTYPAVIFFHTPETFVYMFVISVHVPLILVLACTPMLKTITARPFPPDPDGPAPTATPES